MRDGIVLTIIEVNANPGWTAQVERSQGASVEVYFFGATERGPRASMLVHRILSGCDVPTRMAFAVTSR